MDNWKSFDMSVADGAISLHYIVAGEGKPVVLIHGNGESHQLFRTEIPQLVAAGYQVYAPDSRGHGESTQVKEFHYAEMAEDIYDLIHRLGLEKPAYYGHSDGGIIGLLLELKHPGTLSCMAISGTNLTPAGIDPAFTEKFTTLNRQESNPLWTLMLTEPQIDSRELEQIQSPVLVTAGEFDLILPEETEQIVSHLPKGEGVIVPGGDHGSYLDGDERMGEMLIDFFARHGY